MSTTLRRARVPMLARPVAQLYVGDCEAILLAARALDRSLDECHP